MLIINNNTIHPNPWETKMKEAFDLIKKDNFEIIKKADTLDKIGRKDLSNKEFDRINMYYYIIYYNVLIALYVQERANNGKELTYDDLQAKFDIECVINNAGCKGVKAIKIFELFGFTKDFQSNVNDGINYMSLEVGSPVFKIR